MAKKTYFYHLESLHIILSVWIKDTLSRGYWLVMNLQTKCAAMHIDPTEVIFQVIDLIDNLWAIHSLLALVPIVAFFYYILELLE